ncbi:MAG TPA: Ig-like domain-containing protein [Thermodesulfobacteriota bacterium]|nr:Ig-like domain-containing protein [Thermodesulfobacteriota bacterium]
MEYFSSTVLVLSLLSCGDTVEFGLPFYPQETTSLVQVTPANPSLPQGATQQFTATATQANGTSTDVSSQVIWSSSNTSVATVDARGLGAALRPGAAEIVAALGTRSGSTTLTVTSATLSSISVTPGNPFLPLGFTLQLAATGEVQDGTTFDLTNQATWASSDNSVATVGTTGIVRGIAPGIATIRATSRDISGATIVAVTRATLAFLSVTPSSPSVPGTPAGITLQFSATGTFSDGRSLDMTSQAVWSSSNLSVASISGSGLATSVGPGISIISATVQGTAGSTPLVVTSAALTSISVTPVSATLHQGSAQKFTAVGKYSDGTSRDITSQVTWRSDNISVSRVDGTGLATAVAAGTATISASSGNTSASVVVTVS